jgi:Right handed beta helix region
MNVIGELPPPGGTRQAHPPVLARGRKAMNWRPIRPSAMFLIAALLFLGIGAIAPAAYADGTISACGAVIPSTATGTWTVTKNLAGTGNVPCITVSASGVAIDLHGHIIIGPGTGAFGYGINDSNCASPPCHHNIIVANGTIKGFSLGIALSTEYATVSNMILTQNGTGLQLNQGTVDKTQANNNGTGMIVGDASTITNSQANNNVEFGIGLGGSNIVSSGDTVSNSQANGNGIVGMLFDTDGNTVSNSQANGNGFDGGMNFDSINNTVTNSQANGNKGGPGIAFFGGPNNLVTGSIANGNGQYGIFLQCPGNLYGNIASGNTGGNIVASGGCARLGNNPGP